MIKGCLVVMAMSFVLSACSRFQITGSSDVAAELPTATIAISPSPVATSTIIPTLTPTVTPEPPHPLLAVSDQVLDEDGQIIISNVRVLKPGWVVIHADEDGEAGEVLGFGKVDEGEHQEITITVDPLEASSVLHAMLHYDEGEIGAFEYPGPDRPMLVDSDFVSSTFKVDKLVFLPAVSVSDQELTDDGLLVVDRVVATNPGWIALRADENGEPGHLIGYAPIKKGDNEDVAVRINYLEASPTLHAVLYEDIGEDGRFEDLDGQQPVEVEDKPLLATFRAILPPNVLVLDQPVLDGSIMVEQATSYGPGWLVVYHDDEGAMGSIIGWSPLEDGVNYQIAITVTESAVTPILHLMLHEDLETEGEFGFPRTDPAVRYQERLPNPFSLRTDTGNALVTRDQVLTDSNTVTIPIVVVDVATWVVVRDGDITEPGEISGMVALPPGFHRGVVVELDPTIVSERMHVVLHLDDGFIEEFEYPDGVDIPLQRNRSVIQAPFNLLRERNDE